MKSFVLLFHWSRPEERDKAMEVLYKAVNVQKVVTHNEENSPCHGVKFWLEEKSNGLN